MYGDLQFTNGSNKWKGASKVFKINSPAVWHCPFIVGFAGTASDLISVRYFFEDPEAFPKPPKIKQLEGLILTAEREIYVFDNYTKWLKVEEPFSAIGSGAMFATGAMGAGASPKEAVKVAMKSDIYTGFGVKGYRV
jgi:ATP-dependent protease HslVU (ClpYQ) peptidase subunit